MHRESLLTLCSRATNQNIFPHNLWLLWWVVLAVGVLFGCGLLFVGWLLAYGVDDVDRGYGLGFVVVGCTYPWQTFFLKRRSYNRIMKLLKKILLAPFLILLLFGWLIDYTSKIAVKILFKILRFIDKRKYLWVIISILFIVLISINWWEFL